MSRGNTDTITVEWQNFGQAMGHDMWQFYMSPEYSDITLATEDGYEIQSHRIILAMCSPYFRDLFRRHSIQNQTGKCVRSERKMEKLGQEEVMFCIANISFVVVVILIELNFSLSIKYSLPIEYPV